MVRSKSIVVIVVLCLLLSVVALCCTNKIVGNDGAEGQPIESRAVEPVDSMYVFETVDPYTGVTYPCVMYTTLAVRGVQGITDALGVEQVAEVVAERIGQGYELEFSRCCYTETEVPRGELGARVPAVFTVLTMSRDTGNPETWSFATIAYMYVRGAFYTVQNEKVFLGSDYFEEWPDPENDVELIDVDPVLNLPIYSMAFPEYRKQWERNVSCADPDDPESFWTWFKCTARGAAWGCAGAAVGCAYSSDKYGRCVGGGCARGAVGSLLRCSG
jgi:hypothetical protein